MPTYQYVCTECGKPHEAVQAFTDDALTTCPSCGGPLRKVYSAVGVVFKGSGFYRNDSRTSAKSEGGGSSKSSSEGSSEKTSSDKPSSSDKPGSSAEKSGPSADKSSSSSDSKPAAKDTSPAKTSGSGSAA